MPVEKTMAMFASVLIGTGFLIGGFVGVMKVRASRKWPLVAGTITESAVELIPGSDGDSHGVSIRYAYVVNGAPQAVTQSMGSYVRKKSAEAAAERYRVNSSVSVHVNPENPAEAVLEPKYLNKILALVAGVIFLLLAVRLAFEVVGG